MVFVVGSQCSLCRLGSASSKPSRATHRVIPWHLLLVFNLVCAGQDQPVLNHLGLLTGVILWHLLLVLNLICAGEDEPVLNNLGLLTGVVLWDLLLVLNLVCAG